MASRRPPTLTVLFRTPSVLLVLTVVSAAAEPDLRGRVVGISDVDTLTLLTEQRGQYRIRLDDIDTPERRQPYGDRARQALSDLAFGKAVLITVRDHDRYRRVIGRVFVGGGMSAPSWCGKVPPGSTAATATIPACSCWSHKHSRVGGGYGACWRPSACRCGNGGRRIGICDKGGDISERAVNQAAAKEWGIE
jgi:hypothetical protein